VSLRGVLIFTETYRPVVGGGETQARLLAEGLRAEGLGVTVLTRRSDRTLSKTERLDGVDVLRLRPVGRGQLKKWGLVVSCIPALVRRRREYDVVFVSGFRIIGMTAVLAARALGKAVVLKADSRGEMSGAFFAAGLKRIRMTPRSLPFRAFLGVRNAVLRRADAFVAITDGVVEELEGAGVRAEIVHRIPNGVDTRRFGPVKPGERATLRQRLGIAATDSVVVYTGRLVSYKGLPVLLRAWKRIRRAREGVRLILVGAGGLDMHDCEDELKRFVEEHGLGDSVTFTGDVDNVPDYLRASDVFVLPSEDDAFPSSLVEAMACGLAVIATPVGAMASVVEHGRNGLMVAPGEEAELHEALRGLLDDAELRARLGAEAVRTATARYGSDGVVGRLLELFAALRSPEAGGASSGP